MAARRIITEAEATSKRCPFVARNCHIGRCMAWERTWPPPPAPPPMQGQFSSAQNSGYSSLYPALPEPTEAVGYCTALAA